MADEQSKAQQRAAERKKRLEEQRRKQAEARAQKEAESKIEAKAKEAKSAEPERDWSSDLGGLIKKAPSGTAKAIDAITDVALNKQSWKNTWEAMKDGPGGKEIQAKDLANMALDATWLVPGAGVAGGAARMAARGAMAGRVAKGLHVGKAARTGELSAAATRAEARLAGGAAKATPAAPAATGAHAAGAHRGETAGRKMLDNLALRAERGGTRIGLGQSKRGVLRSAAVAGGLNAGAELYNAAVNKGKAAPIGTPNDDGVVDMSKLGASLGSGAAGYYFLDASGDASPMPDSAAKAIAAQYANMGGSPDGSQVIYMGR